MIHSMKFLAPLFLPALSAVLLACAPGASPFVDGETVGVTGDVTEGAGEGVEEIEPIIDWAEPEPSSEATVQTGESAAPAETQDTAGECSDTIDEDGDGLSCYCDENDGSARDYTVLSECDGDGDAIPDDYDLCPGRADTAVTVVMLCDKETELPGIWSLVAYDDERWECSGGRQMSFSVVKINPSVGSTLTPADFPIAYVFTDDDQDNKPDSCESRVKGDFTVNGLLPNSFQIDTTPSEAP